MTPCCSCFPGGRQCRLTVVELTTSKPNRLGSPGTEKYTHIYTHTMPFKYLIELLHTYKTQTGIHTYIHRVKHTHTYIHTSIHPYIHTCKNTCKHTYIHT